MPKPTKGELRWTKDGPAARITLRGRERRSFLLSSARTEAEAVERMAALTALAARFRKAKVIDTPDALRLLEMAASAAPAMLKGVLQVAGELCGGELDLADGPKVPTFAELAEDWTSGRLHGRHPDHVRAKKDSNHDANRLATLCRIDVGGVAFGDLHVDRMTVDHAETVMRNLPKEAKRPGTRRHYAQLVSPAASCRVLASRLLSRFCTQARTGRYSGPRRSRSHIGCCSAS